MGIPDNTVYRRLKPVHPDYSCLCRRPNSNGSDDEKYQTVREDTQRKTKSQDGVGVGTTKCEWPFSENRKTASGCHPGNHTVVITESQYGVGIPPPGCVRV